MGDSHIFIKVIIVLIASQLMFDKEGGYRLWHPRNLFAAVLSMAWMVIGYVVVGSILYGSIPAGLASAPGLILEGVVNIAAYYAIAAALEKAHVRRLLHAE